MTDQEINIAIADACGWIWRKGTPITYGGSYIPAGWINDKDFRLHLPNYCADLNAMHEAILGQTEKDGFGFQAMFQLRLQEVIERRRKDLNREQIGWWMNNATAHQRAEAFLRTIGKWKE